MSGNEFDVARARRETPGCENVLHFNNAGASRGLYWVEARVIEEFRPKKER